MLNLENNKHLHLGDDTLDFNVFWLRIFSKKIKKEKKRAISFTVEMQLFIVYNLLNKCKI